MLILGCRIERLTMINDLIWLAISLGLGSGLMCVIYVMIGKLLKDVDES